MTDRSYTRGCTEGVTAHEALMTNSLLTCCGARNGHRHGNEPVTVTPSVAADFVLKNVSSKACRPAPVVPYGAYILLVVYLYLWVKRLWAWWDSDGACGHGGEESVGPTLR